jgi:methylthioribose-1-phosphate isomerase
MVEFTSGRNRAPEKGGLFLPGRYLKALAARDNGVPFYAALPSSTIDFTIGDGIAEIPIEQRGPRRSRQ